MSDQDYIRKAMELAGFPWGHRDDGVFHTPWRSSIKPLSECELDALAAQLVRQVDALEGGYIHLYANRCVVGRSAILRHAAAGSSRTMNTIKAIVDSEVLQ